jgi:spermidine/putrescine transport system substrate-binding protein
MASRRTSGTEPGGFLAPPAATNVKPHNEIRSSTTIPQGGDFMDIEEFKSRLANRDISRRQVMQAMSAAGLALAAMPLSSKLARADDQATYFTWSGYDDPGFFPAYVKKYGGNPNLPIFSDEQEAFQKLMAGFVADVAHPCSGRIEKWRNAKLIKPFDTSRLSNWPDVFEPLKHINTADQGGQQWFAPIDWGNTAVIYRSDVVQPKEKSWELLWDERYKGKISMGDDITDTGIITGLLIGAKDPYAMTDDELKQVKAKLAAQKPLVRFYWSDTTVLEQGIASGEIVAASAWNGTLAKMLDQGIPVTWMAPKEGMLTWVCGAVLTTNAPQPDKAHDLIDALISKEAGLWLINDIGYGHSNSKAFKEAGAEKLARIGLPPEPTEHLKQGVFSKDNTRLEDLTQIFEQVKAGV